MKPLFSDRASAGRALAEALMRRREDLVDPVVLGLPRGGLPVGREIARALGAPLDVLVVRKLGHPWQPELAIGAVGAGGVLVLNSDVIRECRVSEEDLRRITETELREVERRERTYRIPSEAVPLEGRTAILVDDGIATGSTMRAAIRIARGAGAEKVVVAVPLAPEETIRRMGGEADEVVCLAMPEPFVAIGMWYASFPQLDDADVRRILREDDGGAGDLP